MVGLPPFEDSLSRSLMSIGWATCGWWGLNNFGSGFGSLCLGECEAVAKKNYLYYEARA